MRELIGDGWRQGNDGLWRNDRFGGSYKTENAIQRVGSQRGEVTRAPSFDDESLNAANSYAEVIRTVLAVAAVATNILVALKVFEVI